MECELLLKRYALHFLIVAVLLSLMFGLAVGSMLCKSPTFDEGFYIARGWVYWRIGHLMPLGHPPLTNLISGLGVLLEPGLPDPRTLDGWQEDNPELLSEDLLWHQGVNANRVVFLARLPSVFLGLLLGAVIWRWGRELYGPWSAALALGLYVLCPNILANTQLATTDLGVAAFYIMTLYAWSCFLNRRTRRWLITSGVLFGLAQASKFSALLLIPTLGLMTLWTAWQDQAFALFRKNGTETRRVAPLLARLGSALLALVIMGLIGLVTLWGAHLFSFQLTGPGSYLGELQHFLSLASEGHRAYLLGHLSQTGWWYYHPYALLVKTPLPTLALIGVAVGLAALRGLDPRERGIIFPALLYLGFSMLGSLNVGIRYLLPILPLLYLFAARTVAGLTPPKGTRAVVTGTLAVWLLGTNLLIYPDYLAFFNRAAGGPDNGYRLLADSNLDWGQDLPALSEYLRERNAGPIYLSYFGQADPAYYGINYIALPSWPPPPPDPSRPEFYPLNPAPGLYAISASNLVGVQLYEPDSFSYFRDKEPVARIGHSIFIYEVTPIGETPPSWLAQCSVPSALASEDTLRRLTGVPDLWVLYFDCTQTLVFPEGTGWVFLPVGAPSVTELGQPDYVAHAEDGLPSWQAWLVASPPPVPSSTVEFPAVPLPLPVAGHIELLGYQISAAEVAPGETLILTAWWRVREPPVPPVSIFAHLLDANGNFIKAGDGLGIGAEYWRPGMVIIQQHRFEIDQSLPPGEYRLAAGLYSLSTGQRFVISRSGDRVVDRITLRAVRITPPAER